MKLAKISLIHKIDFMVIFVSAFGMIFLVGYMNPMVISPVDNLKTSDSEILFSVEKADYILIDDNVNFTTPDKYPLTEGLKIDLKPGKYYWKAVGVLESDVRTLDILSEVNLELKKIDGENYGVYNAGNVKLKVEVYNKSQFVDEKKLPVGSSINFSENNISKIMGADDEK